MMCLNLKKNCMFVPLVGLCAFTTGWVVSVPQDWSSACTAGLVCVPIPQERLCFCAAGWVVCLYLGTDAVSEPTGLVMCLCLRTDDLSVPIERLCVCTTAWVVRLYH